MLRVKGFQLEFEFLKKVPLNKENYNTDKQLFMLELACGGLFYLVLNIKVGTLL